MKKIKLLPVALLLAVAVVFAAGCQKTDKESKSGASVTSEKTANVGFKSGTWAGDDGVKYVFYADGKSGRNVSVSDGMGISFEYEFDVKGK